MKEIILGKNARKYKGYVALVDDEDFEELNQFSWCAVRGGQWSYSQDNFYAVRAKLCSDGVQRVVRMHRELLNASKGAIIDHINHNSLDNRRENLRFCTCTENLHNSRPSKYGTSKFKGVHRGSSYRKWCACIKIDSKVIKLGRFIDELEAAKAYDVAAKEHFGEFAYLNFK